MFDQTRQKAFELEQEIQKIQDIKFSVDSGKLIETLNDVRALRTEISELSGKVWNIGINISTDEIVRNIEQQLSSRWTNRQSTFRKTVEGSYPSYGNE